jgi:hypothetical protein
MFKVTVVGFANPCGAGLVRYLAMQAIGQVVHIGWCLDYILDVQNNRYQSSRQYSAE